MGRRLPTPINGTEQYLAAIHDRLGELLDRIPASTARATGGPVELREPAAPLPPAGPVVSEPPPAQAETTGPDRQAARPTARKPATRRAVTSKKKET